jgi:hypothetical protein
MFIEGQTSITLKNYPILRSLNPQNVSSAELESDLVRVVTALDQRDTSAKDVQGWNFLTSDPLTCYFAPGSANVGVGPFSLSFGKLHQAFKFGLAPHAVLLAIRLLRVAALIAVIPPASLAIVHSRDQFLGSVALLPTLVPQKPHQVTGVSSALKIRHLGSLLPVIQSAIFRGCN